jgi:hypothetical protein
MEKEANTILTKFKNGEITLDKARRLLFVLSGVSKSASCRLDRLPNECSIILNTSLKTCNGCGHYC